MLFIILIAFVSLIGLLVIHEFGHFILAKKFGVKVEEFGVGLPPRIFGKKIGETIYSVNLLPFGAFVKICGEDESVDDAASFRKKPFWQRALILLGGVLSFWLVAAILLGVVMGLGVPNVIDDEANGNLINPKVQIAAIAPDSPAEKAGLKVGDTIKQFNKIKEVQEFTNLHKGEEIILTIERGKEILEFSLVPRILPPEGEGAMGVALVRTAIKKYAWYQAPVRGLSSTGYLTVAIVKGWVQALGKLARGVPTGVQLMGPVGIFSLFTQVSQLGIVYFLQFIAIIAVHLALLNVLPIPALDGGKLLFLTIERIRGRPINEKIERKITVFFFTLLIVLIIWITIKDIMRIF